MAHLGQPQQYGPPPVQQHGAAPVPQQQYGAALVPQQQHGGAPPMQHQHQGGASAGLHMNHFGDHHVYGYPTTFMFQDKTTLMGQVIPMRGETYVCNPDGSLAFSTKDAVLTLKNKEVVFDALKRPIASLHKKTISLHGIWQIFRSDSTSSTDHIADIKPGLMDLGGKTIKVILAGQTEPAFIVKGNFLGRQFTFMDAVTGKLVAECKRHGKFSSAMNFLTGQDTFALTVLPGIDTALLVLVTLVLDDILLGAKEKR